LGVGLENIGGSFQTFDGESIMIVVNTESVPGYEISQMLGLVQGNTIRAKHVGRDIMASFKNLVGGELKGYTELLTEARRQAVERMMRQAEQLGADAIVNVRFTTSAVTQGAAELYAYGTAVRLVAVEVGRGAGAVGAAGVGASME
jgi:uncharacterized protein YbjQ (UPF0145 family)